MTVHYDPRRSDLIELTVQFRFRPCTLDFFLWSLVFDEPGMLGPGSDLESKFWMGTLRFDQ